MGRPAAGDDVVEVTLAPGRVDAGVGVGGVGEDLAAADEFEVVGCVLLSRSSDGADRLAEGSHVLDGCAGEEAGAEGGGDAYRRLDAGFGVVEGPVVGVGEV